MRNISDFRNVEDVADLNAASTVEDPYPTYEKIRNLGPIAWCQAWDMWLVTGHEESQALLREPGLNRVFHHRSPAELWNTFNWLNSKALLDLEGLDHTLLRRAFAPFFKPSAIRSLQYQVERICVELVRNVQNELAEHGEADLVAELTSQLPVRVICSILGVPEEDRTQVRVWSERMVQLFEMRLPPEHIAIGQESSRMLADYFFELVQIRRAHPQEDLISKMIHMGKESIDSQEVVSNIVLLVNGGTGALTNGLGTGLVQMLQDPQLWQEYCEQKDVITQSTIEEIFRFDAPLQLFERTSLIDLDVMGVSIRRGEKVGLLLGAANRDPRRFRNPDRFDLRRSPNPHLSFSAGTHFCLGAPLARLEAQLVLPLLAETLPRMTLSKVPQRIPGLMVRGYEEIHVSCN